MRSREGGGAHVLSTAVSITRRHDAAVGERKVSMGEARGETGGRAGGSDRGDLIASAGCHVDGAVVGRHVDGLTESGVARHAGCVMGAGRCPVGGATGASPNRSDEYAAKRWKAVEDRRNPSKTAPQSLSSCVRPCDILGPGAHSRAELAARLGLAEQRAESTAGAERGGTGCARAAGGRATRRGSISAGR